MIYFHVVLSSGKPIPIDRSEIQDIVNGLNSGSIIVCKQGIFNPSFFVSISEDTKRWEQVRESVSGEGRVLDNLFADVDLLEGSNKQKKLQ